MAIIDGSAKLLSGGNQYKMTSGKYVLFRILNEESGYTLMTATAKEDDGSYVAYPDLERLAGVAERIFSGRGERLLDTWGRPYFSLRVNGHPREVRSIVNMIALELGLEHIEDPWGDEELREIYDELTGYDDDEPFYMSDGHYLEKKGG